MLLRPIIDNFRFNYLIKEVSAGFLYCKSVFPPRVINL